MVTVTKSNKLHQGVSAGFSICLVLFFVFIFSVFHCDVFRDMDLRAWVYYIFTAMAQAATFSFILFVVFFLPFHLLGRRSSFATVVYLIAGMFAGIVALIDTFIFDLYKFHINGFVLELIFGGNASDVFVFDFSLVLKFIGAIVLFVILPTLVLYYLIVRRRGRLRKKGKTVVISLLVVCILISQLGYATARATGEPSVQRSAMVIPLFYPITANSLLKKMGVIGPDDIDFNEYNRPSSDLQYPLHPIVSSDSVPKFNVIYLMMDSWNFSTMDSTITPNIYRFAQRGQVFANHNSNQNGTRGSIFGIFFGLPFTYEDEFNFSKMSPLLIDRMLELGYDIKAFPSATLANPPFNEIVFRRIPDITIRTEGATSFDRDRNLTQNFIDFVERRDTLRPFFSFLFYDTPHAISIPKEFQDRFKPSWESPNYLSLSNTMDRTPFFNLYKNCVFHTDELIGRVLDELERKGLLRNTVVVITGDHGQEFNENRKNYWGHGSNYSKWQLRVPLVVYYPGIEPGKVNHHMTTHFDVAPTLLSRFLGVKNPMGDYSLGHDLWDTVSRYPHIVGDHVRYGFVMPNMIINTNHLGTLELTDLDLNPISRDSIDSNMLHKGIQLKNKFYKK